jgi:mono/diheme cytochrome c family protein
MRFGILIFVAAGVLGAAEPGEAVFDKTCAACHVKEISRDETLARLATLKAPPMIEVSNQLKRNILIKEADADIHRAVVIGFIKHYIENPDIIYSLCNPGALDRFGQMPSMKGKLTRQEIEDVAAWVYDYYEGREF